MRTYTAPALTRIGSFKDATRALGSAPLNDFWGYPALYIVYPD